MNNTTVSTGVIPWQTQAQRVSGLIICPIGIISSLLSMGSLWRKITVDKNIFFSIMLIIACLDLLFNCGYLYIRGSNPPKSLTKYIFIGLTYSTSLAADLCALALTIERYLALSWPEMMRNLSAKNAKFIRGTAAFVISVISVIRMYYVLFYLEYSSGFPPDSLTVTWISAVRAGVVMSIDMVLPIILTASMCFFSFKIVRVVVNRRKVRANAKATNPSKFAASGPSGQSTSVAVTSVQKVQAASAVRGGKKTRMGTDRSLIHVGTCR